MQNFRRFARHDNQIQYKTKTADKMLVQQALIENLLYQLKFPIF